MDASRLLSVVFALSLVSAPANAASLAAPGSSGAPVAGQTGSACGLANQSQYWLCKALEEGSCGLTSVSEEYWFCKGIVDRQCGLIEGGNYNFCQALITPNCNLVRGNGYRLCRGIIEQDCSLAPQSLAWMCMALQARFRA
ncbi:MAG: hypothetical protein KL785_06170 [Brevundimonas sp.]|nr:hypothetical protein [Brevundimonas sp.]MBX9460736.1 hypothetical protein [Brevundimonas sp.]